MQIDQSTPSPNFESRDGQPITLLVLHATVGSFQSARAWLTNPVSKASTHYLIAKTGRIAQLVAEDQAAWHAGRSAYKKLDSEGVKLQSIGIELENRNDGKDPYPLSQLLALRWLTLDIFSRMPRLDIVTHASVARPIGRKTDPRGFPMDAFLASLDAPEPQARYTQDSPIMGLPTTDLATVALRFPIHTASAYSDLFIQTTILPAYWELAQAVHLDPLVAIAQMGYETGYLTSFWSQPPQHNPAGIGVTGNWQLVPPKNPAGWAYNTQRGRWEQGVSFLDFPIAIRAHVGRLVAYATQPAERTPMQQLLVSEALSYRPLPPKVHGSAVTLKQLGKAHNPSGQGWASPGTDYGTHLAGVANRLAGLE